MFKHGQTWLCIACGIFLLSGCGKKAITQMPGSEVIDAEPKEMAMTSETGNDEVTPGWEKIPDEEMQKIEEEPATQKEETRIEEDENKISIYASDSGDPGSEYSVKIDPETLNMEVRQTNFSSAPGAETTVLSWDVTLTDEEFSLVEEIRGLIEKEPEGEISSTDLCIGLRDIAKGEELYADKSDLQWEMMIDEDLDGDEKITYKEAGRFYLENLRTYLYALNRRADAEPKENDKN